MKNREIDNIDDDIVRETRPSSIIKVKPKWSGGDIILPIIIKNKIVLKRIEDTSIEEFVSWLKQVMPFSSEEINTYINRGINNIREKMGLFDSAVLLHAKRWLFGLGEPEQPHQDIKWS